MLILLPPSEGKAGAGNGPPLDLATLSFPELNPTRERVLAALAEVSTRTDAHELLGLPKGQKDAALERNRALYQAPTLEVSKLYTGVLYDNLALPEIDPLVATERIVIFSGLWGALRLTDRIPPYRLAMNVSLPALGTLAAMWRPALNAALRPDGLVVDMRSAPYSAAWRPSGTAGPSGHVAVRVFREWIINGVPKRTVVSHMAKATRGRVAHDLLSSGENPETPEELLKLVSDLGYTAELNGSNLDVVQQG